MKKWFFPAIGILVILVLATYLFIPSKSVVSAASGIRSSHEAAFRIISNEQSWHDWWPGEVKPGNIFVYEGREYTIADKRFQGLQIKVKGKQENQIRVILLPVTRDSMEMELRLESENGFNPLLRWNYHRNAQDFKQVLPTILNSFKKYVENTANVYGNLIEELNVKDSIILYSSSVKNEYPGVDQVYSVVRNLKQFALSKGARETNYPMLNIDSTPNGYLLRVGLPIDREPDVQGTKFEIKRMVLGMILVSEVKGGPASIKEGFRQVEQYMTDHERKTPAIPYESLVTDRSKEADTGKWITRIYYPVY